MTPSRALGRARAELDGLIAGALDRTAALIEDAGGTPAEIRAEVAIQARELALWRAVQLAELGRVLSDSRVQSGVLH